jgi:small-conductance mechanosensitive channel
MESPIRLAGPNDAVELFGIKLLGINAESGRKLILSLVFIALVVALRTGLRFALGMFPAKKFDRMRFWAIQGISLLSAAFLILGLVSIWFDDPTRLATAFGLVTAGLAFALQQVVTAVAGYFVILRGKTFNVGDRIRMGGVRGDVLALGFMQTTIMEMGKPPAEEDGNNATWVESRQYTGRIVTGSNAEYLPSPSTTTRKIFPSSGMRFMYTFHFRPMTP